MVITVVLVVFLFNPDEAFIADALGDTAVDYPGIAGNNEWDFED